MWMQTDWFDLILFASVIGHQDFSFLKCKVWAWVHLWFSLAQDIMCCIFVSSTPCCSSALWISWNVTELEENIQVVVHFNCQNFNVRPPDWTAELRRVTVTHRGRSIANVEKCKNKTLLQQPKKCNQMASTACWIGTYSSFFFSLWWCARCYTFDLGAMAQSTSLPWQTAACIDCLTQTFEDTLKWRRPDGRDDFSMSCHNGKTEYEGQVLDKKTLKKSHSGLV